MYWRGIASKPNLPWNEDSSHVRRKCAFGSLCIAVYHGPIHSTPTHGERKISTQGVGRWKERAFTSGGEKNLHTRRGMVEGPCAHEWRRSCAFLLHRCRHVFSVVATISVALGISTSTFARISLPLGRDSRSILNAHISVNLRRLGLLDPHDSWRVPNAHISLYLQEPCWPSRVYAKGTLSFVQIYS